MSNPPEAETILFRPSKKRKIYRQREREESPAPVEPAQQADEQTLDELITSTSATAELESTNVPISEILRLRKQRKARVGGVEFRTFATALGKDEETDGAEMIVHGEDEAEKKEVELRKFAPQTGMIGDVNKHMMAYIDSQLAARSSPSLSSSSAAKIKEAALFKAQEKNQRSDLDIPRQPASLGKLMEIDLGDEARARNIERTNQAQRRLNGEDISDSDDGMNGDGKKKKPPKVRLGRDGKPFRSRRKRRGSDDVKRDALVEAILKENRLEIYDPPPQPEKSANDDQAADDRIAEEFRREFMDAVSQRHRKKAAPPPPSGGQPGKKGEEDVLKGPKLGGSRSARAAMRESLLKNAKK
ncbi:hypothetical protein PVAG01_10885 [Phlyctema vagabunda]|uniref:Uncharacterized protein n=1 Tax=Phlyctema vagabunda TaxID=108571 RepID=A0ABR4P460_9HELO